MYFAVLIWEIRATAAVGTSHVLIPTWLVIAFIGYLFVVDIALTFVAPALAYTTPRLIEAWRIGMRMLRTTWPNCAVYALLPPLTLLALGTVNPTGFRAEVAVIVSVASTLIGLLTKGAIASFYLENAPASEEAFGEGR